MKKIIFKTGSLTFAGLLNSSQAASEIFANLPVTSEVSRWGKEIYFNLGFKVSSELATSELTCGDIGYWPQGKALCIFYGPTPFSEEEDQPVPASPVVIIGKTSAKAELLDQVKLGQTITVAKQT